VVATSLNESLPSGRVPEGRERSFSLYKRHPVRPPGSGKISSGRDAVAVFGPGNGALIHDVNQQGQSPTG
jgi:hypothetical protein